LVPARTWMVALMSRILYFVTFVVVTSTVFVLLVAVDKIIGG
jgi:hypothetical protein